MQVNACAGLVSLANVASPAVLPDTSVRIVYILATVLPTPSVVTIFLANANVNLAGEVSTNSTRYLVHFWICIKFKT